jgi:uncharacterized membrane protein YhfC
LNIGTIIAFIMSLLLQVGVPLAVTLYYRRRTDASWQLFIYGGIIFALFQIFSWLPLSVYLDVAFSERITSATGSFVWLLMLALVTSLVEEAGRWIGFHYLFPRGSFRLTWRNGVMYGLGHGSVETLFLIAGLTFINLLAYIMLSRLDIDLVLQSLGAEATPALQEILYSILNTSWIQPLVVAFERMLMLIHQVAWSLLVMQSLSSRQKRWFGFAVLYHTSVAVIVPGLARLSGFTLAEIANTLLAVLSLWIILKLRSVSAEDNHLFPLTRRA